MYNANSGRFSVSSMLLRCFDASRCTGLSSPIEPSVPRRQSATAAPTSATICGADRIGAGRGRHGAAVSVARAARRAAAARERRNSKTYVLRKAHALPRAGRRAHELHDCGREGAWRRSAGARAALRRRAAGRGPARNVHSEALKAAWQSVKNPATVSARPRKAMSRRGAPQRASAAAGGRPAELRQPRAPGSTRRPAALGFFPSARWLSEAGRSHSPRRHRQSTTIVK